MKPHESPRINKKSIRGDSRDSWPVWNRGIRYNGPLHSYCVCGQRRFMHVCAHARAKAQNNQSLCCLHTRSMDVDEGSDKKFRPLALLSIPEYRFIRDILRICDEYRNLVCCLQFCVHAPRRKGTITRTKTSTTKPRNTAKILVQIYVLYISFTRHKSLASFLLDVGKQCRP